MKNTNSKEYKEAVKAYLIPIIQDRAAGMEKTIEGNPFKWVLDVARREVPECFKQYGEQGGLCHWLQGLGMGIDYTNYAILQLAATWHDCQLTDKEADTIITNWFNHIALKILQFSRGF